MVEVKTDYHVILAGAGAVVQEKFTPEVLDKLGSSTQRYIFDLDHRRLLDAETRKRSSKLVVADGEATPFKIPEGREREYVGIVATPEHLGVIRSLTESGVRKFIVEKPLVNNTTEIAELHKLLSQYPDLKVYPLDFYVQKATPLLVLTGAISSDDPRREWVTEGTSGDLYEHIGELEGIQVTVFEGGGFGLPDLAKRKWLEEDSLRGGQLLDLGTHAFTPLIAAGVIPVSGVKVESATREILGDDRHSFTKAPPYRPEIVSKATLSIPASEGYIPCIMTVGKSFHSGGMWELVLRGSRGDLVMGLRTGQRLTVIPKSAPTFEMSLKINDPYGLAFQEADMYFRGIGGFDGNLPAMLKSIEIIDQIKAKSP